MADRDPSKGEVKLAAAAPFRLGEVEVIPATRQLVRGARSETLEPRVMQVLVALAEARGAVLSRDELIDRCWGGRIVGENAINRVISRIRQAAADFGMDSFQLETITKVGYRMVVPEAAAQFPPLPQAPVPWPEQLERPRPPRFDLTLPVDRPAPMPAPGTSRRPSRRAVVAGGTLLAGGAAAGLWYLAARPPRHEPAPAAVELHRLGQIAQRQGVPEQVRQAVSFFRQATEIDPLYAEAWGGLAISYRHILEGYAQGEAASLPGLIQAAADRALALDLDNADALLARTIIRPYYRNWTWMERELRPLGERFPDHWFVHAQLALIRYDVGRWRDGLPHSDRVVELEPHIPIAQGVRAQALWSLGRLQEAEAVLDAALRRWPGYYFFWDMRYAFLLANGRAESAAAFLLQPDTRPERLAPGEIETRARIARAVEGRQPAQVAASVAELQGHDARAAQIIVQSAPLYVLLGRPELALAGMERYFFGPPPPGPYERRRAAFIFMPVMAPLWTQPRFGALLDRAGFEQYWRESGTRPDFRTR